MGRWTQYDEDSYRLPEGMKRVGYDSDTSKYYFRDRDGTLWEGPEGAEYGEMRQVSDAPIALDDHDEHAHNEEDLEAAPTRADGYQPLAVDPDQPPHRSSGNTQAYKMLFPFLLIVAVVLLLVIRLVVYHSRPDPDHPDASLCPGKSEVAQVNTGDTCWKLAQTSNSTLEELLHVNPGLDCNQLLPGQSICLPKAGCMD
ncbi:carbohydrate-binding module family 50 protein [Laetiporus sulphureus 93-53]|uniref:Carbohydrate-binding module family 50 protein n=1 Tax=Laetiporus sulphureus 93-53 TaxID=1314785 RepID=A0A165C579_9APHY|nr:carbohydrate-binding module family 50 protein [Laetiporus sulphureus 93-53]KZT02226.1 carbohydrate-binding module family 50 protein [Laetiporus sulphureus 93-53]